jgi:hypothetical protein
MGLTDERCRLARRRLGATDVSVKDKRKEEAAGFHPPP